VVEAVLEEAAALFFERGFTPVTTAEVSRAAGVSKKTLYRLLPSKEALLLAVVRREMGAFARRLDAIASAPGEAADLVAARREFMRVLAAQLARVGRVLGADLRRAPRLWEQIDRLRREVVLARLDGLLARGRDAGVVRDDIDPALVRELHLVLIQSLVTPEQIFKLEMSPLALYEGVIRIVYGGILTARGRRGLARGLGKGNP